MISIKDHEDENGKVDWEAYRKAQVENGESCYRCGHFLFPGTGFRELCIPCQDLDKNSEEVESQSILRCPHCGHQRHVDWEDAIGEEGEHTLYCNNCEKDFEISTRVEYYFTSPPLDKEKKDDDTLR